ncbi:hypothetical protein KSP39_PZI020216 [Platanthera zijinensis]|uniref:Uncharacterized protein n=1 Tax=Platanthera zijinensis TaxID=2320716 RepID=A0AAP0FWM2_9ASPA
MGRWTPVPGVAGRWTPGPASGATHADLAWCGRCNINSCCLHHHETGFHLPTVLHDAGTDTFSHFQLCHYYDYHKHAVPYSLNQPKPSQLAVNRAVTIWRLVLAGRFRLLDQWCSFTELKLSTGPTFPNKYGSFRSPNCSSIANFQPSILIRPHYLCCLPRQTPATSNDVVCASPSWIGPTCLCDSSTHPYTAPCARSPASSAYGPCPTPSLDAPSSSHFCGCALIPGADRLPFSLLLLCPQFRYGSHLCGHSRPTAQPPITALSYVHLLVSVPVSCASCIVFSQPQSAPSGILVSPCSSLTQPLHAPNPFQGPPR